MISRGACWRTPSSKLAKGTSSTICAPCSTNHIVDAGLYADQPVPLLAGAVGYFGYEAGYFIEDMPDLGADDLGMPDVYFMFHDVLLAHCHRTERSFLSVVGRGATEDGARQHANRLRDDMLQRIEAFDAEPAGPEWTGPPRRARRGGRGRSEITFRFARLLRTSRALQGTYIRRRHFRSLLDASPRNRVGRRPLGFVSGASPHQSGAVRVVLEFPRGACDLVLARALYQLGSRPRGREPADQRDAPPRRDTRRR